MKKQIEVSMEQAAQQYAQTPAPARVFQQFFYYTQETWSRERRVVAKAEHLDKGANPWFVTSLSEEQEPLRQFVRETVLGRGESENRVKEQPLDLFAEGTSTHQMCSNQLRLYFFSIAYVLLQTLRRIGLSGTEMGQVQCGTIRRKLLRSGRRSG